MQAYRGFESLSHRHRSECPAGDETLFAAASCFASSEVAGFRRAGHYGDIPGFAADVGFYPDLGLGIVTLTNTDFGAANPPRDLERTVLADPAIATAHS